MTPPSSTDSLTGKALAGRYRLLDRLATGGMAEVWLADDQVLGRRVAVKILHRHLASDPVFVERFRAEARVAARLSHPGIVSIFDTVSEPDVEAIVMELLCGVDLRAFLDENGPLSPEMVRDLGAQVADAIEAAHQAGLVHRDIKPGNIMLVDERRTKVTDFGIAKPRDGADLTEHGTLVGTAKYLSPEQVRSDGPVDGRADLYALGVVLFECLTGEVPFSGDSDVAVALARLDRDPPRVRSFRTTVPPSLDAVVHRAMAVDPDDRHATAAELRAALLAADDATIIGDATTVTAAAAPEAAAAEPSQFISSERHWMVPTVLIVVVAVALGIAGALLGTTDVGRDAVTRAREAVGLAERQREPLESSLPDADDADSQAAPAAEVIAAATFDPGGVGVPGENDEAVGLAIDGDPDTGWTTESYDSRAFGGLKSGVGLVVSLDHPAPLRRLTVSGPSVGWAASVHVAPAPAETLDGWGPPITTVDDVDGGFRIDVDGSPSAGAVLVWITDLGDGPPRVNVQIDEIDVVAGGEG